MEEHKIYEKPEECPICMEDMKTEENPLECGHWMHISCVRQHFKKECPICRRKINIEINSEEESLSFPNNNNGFRRFVDSVLSTLSFRRFERENNDWNIIVNHNNENLDNNDPINNTIFENLNNNDNELINNMIFIESGNESGNESDEENPRGDNWDYEDV